jgi:hypothetical protein
MIEFWKGVFSDNGSPSFSRVATGLIVAFSCGWVTHIVWTSHALPDFAGLALFIGTLYGLNRMAGLFGNTSATEQQTKVAARLDTAAAATAKAGEAIADAQSQSPKS